MDEPIDKEGFRELRFIWELTEWQTIENEIAQRQEDEVPADAHH